MGGWGLAASIGLASCLICRVGGAQPGGQTPASAAPGAESRAEEADKSVVKIISVLRYPDAFQPWSKKAPVTSYASGVVIEGKRILTIAHAVACASEVQVLANETGDKVTASVEGISPEVDLAVLKLEEDTFFSNHPPLGRGLKLPGLKDPVTAYGYPAESSKVGSIKGSVLRIDFAPYNGANALRIQMDTPIPPGASGGPVVAEEKMIGLSFPPAGKPDGSSYAIPCEEIEMFLKGVHEGGYHGRPRLDVVLQELKNPTLRAFLGVDKTVHGVVVQQVAADPADSPLRKWDIITQVGQTDVDDEGMIALGNGPQVAFTYLLSQAEENGKVPMTVVRSGQRVHLAVPVPPSPPRLLPGLNGIYPDYFVYGPLCFSDASQDYLFELMNSIVGGSGGLNGTLRLLDQDTPLVARCDDLAKFEGERLVVVTTFFQHKIAESYASPVTQVVKTINGVPIKNLAHMVEVLRDSKEKFIRIEFFGRYSRTLVFPREEMVAETEAILTDNNVHSQGSAEMLAIWKGRKKE